jgi:hypothetical protein
MDEIARKLMPAMVCGHIEWAAKPAPDLIGGPRLPLISSSPGLTAFFCLAPLQAGHPRVVGLCAPHSVIPGLAGNPCAVKIDVEVPVTVGILLLGARRTLRPPCDGGSIAVASGHGCPTSRA